MKKYKIVFLPDAADDRDEIKSYLVQFGEGSVERFFALLRKTTTNLKRFCIQARLMKAIPTIGS